MVPPTVQKKGYLTWSPDMDNLLTSTLYAQITEGNKGDGVSKLKRTKLRFEMGISVTVDHVSNQIKVWKKRHAI